MSVTTKAQLYGQLRQARQATGLDLGLSMNSPGDGVTRYRVTLNGGSRDLGRVFLGRGDAYDGLRLLNDVLYQILPVKYRLMERLQNRMHYCSCKLGSCDDCKRDAAALAAAER